MLRFTLPAEDPIELTVHDVRGRLVRRLVGGAVGLGGHEIAWDGRDDAGQAVASGVYFARITQRERTSTIRVVMVR
jgi:flagellar hook assembly protein FlgD